MVSIEPDRELLGKLRREQQKTPELDEIMGFHRELIEARVRVEPQGPHLEPDEREVEELIDNRLPLLQRWGLRWDDETFARVCAPGSSVEARHHEDLAAQFGSALGEIEAAGVLTHRFKAFNLNGGRVNQLGMLWH